MSARERLEDAWAWTLDKLLRTVQAALDALSRCWCWFD